MSDTDSIGSVLEAYRDAVHAKDVDAFNDGITAWREMAGAALPPPAPPRSDRLLREARSVLPCL